MGVLPPTEAGRGLGDLPSRNYPGVVAAEAVAEVVGGEEGAAHSHLPREEGVARNSWAAGCSNRDVGAGTPTAVVADGDAGTGKDRVDQQAGAAEGLHRSNQVVVVGKCREAGTGLDTGLPPGASDGGRAREAVAAEGVEEEECRDW